MATFIKSPINNRQNLSVDEAHAEYGLSPWTWRAWAYSGKVASIKAGSRLLIPRNEIERVMSEGLRQRKQAVAEVQ